MPDQRTELVRKMIAEGTSDNDILATLKVYDSKKKVETKPAPTRGGYKFLSDVGDATLGLVKGFGRQISDVTGVLSGNPYGMVTSASEQAEGVKSNYQKAKEIGGFEGGARKLALPLDLIGIPATQTAEDIIGGNYGAALVHGALAIGGSAGLSRVIPRGRYNPSLAKTPKPIPRITREDRLLGPATNPEMVGTAPYPVERIHPGATRTPEIPERPNSRFISNELGDVIDTTENYGIPAPVMARTGSGTSGIYSPKTPIPGYKDVSPVYEPNFGEPLSVPEPLVTTNTNLIAAQKMNNYDQPQVTSSQYGIVPRDIHEATPGLNVVPSRIQPPGPNQAVFEALVPENLGSRTRYRSPEARTIEGVPPVQDVSPIVDRPSPIEQRSKPLSEVELKNAEVVRAAVTARKAKVVPDGTIKPEEWGDWGGAEGNLPTLGLDKTGSTVSISKLPKSKILSEEAQKIQDTITKAEARGVGKDIIERLKAKLDKFAKSESGEFNIEPFLKKVENADLTRESRTEPALKQAMREQDSGRPYRAARDIDLRKLVERRFDREAARELKIRENESKGPIKRFLESEEGSFNLDVFKRKPKTDLELLQSEIDTFDKKRDSALRQVYDKIGTSSARQLERFGPKGEELSKLMHTTRTEGARLGGEYASRVREVAKTLNQKEHFNVVDALDGQISVGKLSPKESQAYTELRKVTEELGELGEQSGMHIRTAEGKSVPFSRAKENYFPHKYPDRFFERGDLVDQLIKQGKTAEQAQRLIDRSRQFGERYISPQHAREFNLPGYHRKLEVLEKYAYDMGQRITESKAYGARDIADKSSTISKLINSTSNPAKANELINNILGRGPKFDSASHTVGSAVRRFQVATHLSQFIINNVGDLALVPHRAGIKNFFSAVKETLSNPKMATTKATKTGALAILRREALKDMELGNFTAKAYGIAPMEKALRTISSLSGRSAALDFFNKAKKGNRRAARDLSELIDVPIEEIMKLDKLSPEQVDFAGGRMVEITSGLPDKLTLPPAFLGHPILTLPLLFKRFAFTTTKNIVSAIRANPKAAPAIMATYIAIGEVTGDIKAGIKGAVRAAVDEDTDLVEGITDKILKRGDYIGSGNVAIDRLLANAMQSWLFGLIGDVTESFSRGGKSVAGLVGGPVGSDIMEFADSGRALIKGNASQAKKTVLKRVPFIGAGLADQIKPVDKVSPYR